MPLLPMHRRSTTEQMAYYGRVGVAGGMCACAAHTILVPIDVLKTMLQVDPSKFPSTQVAYRHVVQESGVLGLFRGMIPTSIGYFQQGFLKFALYEAFKPRAMDAVGAEVAEKNTLPLYMACAATAEVFASSLLVPWEALRIRQVSSREYSELNVVRGMAKMVRENGTSVLYRGLPSILMKQVPYTVVQLSAFTSMLSVVYEDLLPKYAGKRKEDLAGPVQIGISVSVGMLAGALSSIASHPGDAILTRINTQLKLQAAGGAAAAPRPTITAMARELGPRGLCVGMVPRCLMTAGLSAIMFLVYDSCRVIMGLPASGGKAADEDA